MDDLEFAHKPLKKNFRGFMTHVICHAQHFGEFEDSEETVTANPFPNKPSLFFGGSRQNSQTGPPRFPAKTNAAAAIATSTARADKPKPDCLNPQCMLQHYLKDFISPVKSARTNCMLHVHSCVSSKVNSARRGLTPERPTLVRAPERRQFPASPRLSHYARPHYKLHSKAAFLPCLDRQF
jgi:hypothetical protein